MIISLEEIDKRYNEGKMPHCYHNWAKVNEKLMDFEKKANMRVFSKLFEPYAEADRLWNHFTQDCNYKFQQFLKYLTREQKNVLIVNAVENKTLYA